MNDRKSLERSQTTTRYGDVVQLEPMNSHIEIRKILEYCKIPVDEAFVYLQMTFTSCSSCMTYQDVVAFNSLHDRRKALRLFLSSRAKIDSSSSAGKSSNLAYITKENDNSG